MIEKDNGRSIEPCETEEQEQRNAEKNVTWRDMWTKIKSTQLNITFTFTPVSYFGRSLSLWMLYTRFYLKYRIHFFIKFLDFLLVFFFQIDHHLPILSCTLRRAFHGVFKNDKRSMFYEPQCRNNRYFMHYEQKRKFNKNSNFEMKKKKNIFIDWESFWFS